eukprot:42546-Pleurochrysis_carterae.AAC.8
MGARRCELGSREDPPLRHVGVRDRGVGAVAIIGIILGLERRAGRAEQGAAQAAAADSHEQ